MDLFGGEDAIFQEIVSVGRRDPPRRWVPDSLVSSFLANVQPAFRDEDPVGLRVARATTRARALTAPTSSPRWCPDSTPCSASTWWRCDGTASPGTGGGVETREMGAGFVDLVDSTGLALAVTMVELGVLLTESENLTA